MKAIQCLLAAVLGVLATTAPSRVLAQGFIIPELGTRVNGMGAAIGRPDDLSAIYHNPAALALLPGTQAMISFGAAFLSTDVRLRPWDGSDTYITEPVDGDGYYPEISANVFAPIPMIGISSNLFSDKIVGAFGVYVPNAAGAKFGEKQAGRYHVIEATLFSAYFTAALAYRPFDWLSVGLGGSLVYVNIMRRSLLYPVFPSYKQQGGKWGIDDSKDPQDFSATLGTESELTIEGKDFKPSFNLGIQLWPHRTVSIGLMVLTGYDVSLEGPMTLKPDPKSLGAALDGLVDNQQRTETHSPWVFGIGAHWDVTPWLELGYEFRLYLNGANEAQITTITDGELLPTFIKEPIVTPKNLHHSFHTGGGFILRPPLGAYDVELLGGFHYDNTASPDNTFEVSAPSFDLAALHSGVRWAINDLFRVSVLYSHYWYFERETTGSIISPPTNILGSANNNQLTVVLEARFASGIGVTPSPQQAETTER